MPTPDLRDFILSVYVELFERNGKRIDKDPTEAELLAVAEECVLRDRKARDRSLLDERDALRAALTPFADYHGSDQYLLSGAPGHGLCAGVSFTKADYLRARAALSQSTPQTEAAI